MLKEIAQKDAVTIMDLGIENTHLKEPLLFDPKRDITAEIWQNIRQYIEQQKTVLAANRCEAMAWLKIISEERYEENYTWPPVESNLYLMICDQLGIDNEDKDWLEISSRRNGVPLLISRLFQLKTVSPSRHSELEMFKRISDKHYRMMARGMFKDEAVYPIDYWSAVMLAVATNQEAFREQEGLTLQMREKTNRYLSNPPRLRNPKFESEQLIFLKVFYPADAALIRLSREEKDLSRESLHITGLNALISGDYLDFLQEAAIYKINSASAVEINADGLKLIYQPEKPVTKDSTLPGRRNYQ